MLQNGVAGAGLGTGIAGLALGVLNGGLGNLLGGYNGCNALNYCSENMAVNRYELAQEQKIADLQTQVALRDANIYTDQKLADIYERLSAKIGGVEAMVNTQAVYNANVTSTIGCMQGQIAQLQSLTKLVVPNSSVCPGWGAVTITPSTTTTTT